MCIYMYYVYTHVNFTTAMYYLEGGGGCLYQVDTQQLLLTDNSKTAQQCEAGVNDEASVTVHVDDGLAKCT